MSTKNKKKPYLGILVVAAFASLACFFMINGDKNEGWKWTGGIVCGIVALVAGILAFKTPKE